MNLDPIHNSVSKNKKFSIIGEYSRISQGQREWASGFIVKNTILEKCVKSK